MGLGSLAGGLAKGWLTADDAMRADAREKRDAENDRQARELRQQQIDQKKAEDQAAKEFGEAWGKVGTETEDVSLGDGRTAEGMPTGTAQKIEDYNRNIEAQTRELMGGDTVSAGQDLAAIPDAKATAKRAFTEADALAAGAKSYAKLGLGKESVVLAAQAGARRLVDSVTQAALSGDLSPLVKTVGTAHGITKGELVDDGNGGRLAVLTRADGTATKMPFGELISIVQGKGPEWAMRQAGNDNKFLMALLAQQTRREAIEQRAESDAARTAARLAAAGNGSGKSSSGKGGAGDDVLKLKKEWNEAYGAKDAGGAFAPWNDEAFSAWQTLGRMNSAPPDELADVAKKMAMTASGIAVRSNTPGAFVPQVRYDSQGRANIYVTNERGKEYLLGSGVDTKFAKKDGIWKAQDELFARIASAEPARYAALYGVAKDATKYNALVEAARANPGDAQVQADARIAEMIRARPDRKEDKRPPASSSKPVGVQTTQEKFSPAQLESAKARGVEPPVSAGDAAAAVKGAAGRVGEWFSGGVASAREGVFSRQLKGWRSRPESRFPAAAATLIDLAKTSPKLRQQITPDEWNDLHVAAGIPIPQ